MRILTAIMATITAIATSLGIAYAAQAPAPPAWQYSSPQPISADRLEPPAETIVYAHGDCSWVPALALKAGWSADQIPRLQEIILRESGCCPNRAGGDMVDEDCNITGQDGSNHSSDTSLLQINGLNYNPKRNPFAPICLQMKICTQGPLFDPLTNLKAGRLLYDYWEKAAGDGWIPWNICNRTSTCKASTKVRP